MTATVKIGLLSIKYKNVFFALSSIKGPVAESLYKHKDINMMKKHIRLWGLLIALLCSTVTNARQELVFTVGQGAVIQEISFLVLKEAYQKLAIDIAIKKMPNARALASANDGTFDGDVSRVKSIEKKFANLIRVPIEINHLDAQVFSANKNLAVDGWESLRDKQLISVIGIKFVENNLKKRNIACNFLPTFPQAMGMLSRGRADAAIFPRIVGITTSRQANATDVLPVGEPLMKLSLYHYINKKHQATADKLALVLAEMAQSGRISQIRQQYVELHNL